MQVVFSRLWVRIAFGQIFINLLFGVLTGNLPHSKQAAVMLLEINPINPQKRLIQKVVEHLRRGAIIAYPTDTYYGIGCDIMNKKAIEMVYRIKQRSKNKPFSFICSNLKNISDYAKVSNYAYRTMKRLLPGPYTFILDGSNLVPKIMLTKRKTAGIRVPDHAICIALTQELGNPILSTSATLPDRTILYDPFLIHQELSAHIDVVIDGGPVPGSPSSVIALLDDYPEVLRKGLGDVSIFK
jgi:tRNA threonylcarbamoyl adenosine modification protein (Sua5/YciO/YrdC/YwlC family)